MANKSLAQANYQVIAANGQIVLSNKIGSANHAKSEFSPFIANHEIDLSALIAEGEYTLNIKLADGESATSNITVAKNIYNGELTALLTHLKTARSGTANTLNHRVSHIDDG